MQGNHYYKRLGETIVNARKKRKLSQQKLAIIADVDRSYLAEVEKGKANPSVKFLHKIARGLKTRVGELLKNL
ncbi:MAG: helix-turn-helix domain-containing protein [Patescibacteria group bacterium]|nr:helix-turn-helix domain-containing protein [Patescibacteria group bacterium]